MWDAHRKIGFQLIFVTPVLFLSGEPGWVREAQTGSSPFLDTLYFVLVQEVLDGKHIFWQPKPGWLGWLRERPGTHVLPDVEVTCNSLCRV